MGTFADGAGAGGVLNGDGDERGPGPKGEGDVALGLLKEGAVPPKDDCMGNELGAGAVAEEAAGAAGEGLPNGELKELDGRGGFCDGNDSFPVPPWPADEKGLTSVFPVSLSRGLGTLYFLASLENISTSRP